MTINVDRLGSLREAEEVCAADPAVRKLFKALPPDYVKALANYEQVITRYNHGVLMQRCGNTYESLTKERQRQVGSLVGPVAVWGGLRILAQSRPDPRYFIGRDGHPGTCPAEQDSLLCIPRDDGFGDILGNPRPVQFLPSHWAKQHQFMTEFFQVILQGIGKMGSFVGTECDFHGSFLSIRWPGISE